MVWISGLGLFLVGLIRSLNAEQRPAGTRLAIGVAIILMGSVGSLAAALTLTRSLRALPSPPEATPTERVRVIQDIKREALSENVPLELAYAARIAQGNQRVAAMASGGVLLIGGVVLVPGMLQVLGVLVFAVGTVVVAGLTVPQSRRARRVLSQLPAAGGPDPDYQAKVFRQVKTIWRWTGLVCIAIALLAVVLTSVGAIPVVTALAVWISLAVLCSVGYLHASWLARPRSGA